jgi:hypothetical protein
VTCSVYVIAHEEFKPPTKIGVSLDVQKRFGALQSSNPAKLTLFDAFITESMRIAEAVEREFKSQMKDKKIRGEWFDIQPEAAYEKLREINDKVLNDASIKPDDYRLLDRTEKQVLEFVLLDLKARGGMPTIKDICQAKSITRLRCSKALSSLAVKGYIQVCRNDAGKINAMKVYDYISA